MTREESRSSRDLKRENSAKPLDAEWERQRHEPAFVVGIGNDLVKLSIREGARQGEKQEVEPRGVCSSGDKLGNVFMLARGTGRRCVGVKIIHKSINTATTLSLAANQMRNLKRA